MAGREKMILLPQTLRLSWSFFICITRSEALSAPSFCVPSFRGEICLFGTVPRFISKGDFTGFFVNGHVVLKSSVRYFYRLTVCCALNYRLTDDTFLRETNQSGEQCRCPGWIQSNTKAEKPVTWRMSRKCWTLTDWSSCFCPQVPPNFLHIQKF